MKTKFRLAAKAGKMTEVLIEPGGMKSSVVEVWAWAVSQGRKETIIRRNDSVTALTCLVP